MKHTESVIKYRVRLARNFRSCAFPERLDTAKRETLINEVAEIMTGAAGGKHFRAERLDDSNRLHARALMERRLISPEFAGLEPPHAVILSKNEDLSVMICEEDCLRIAAFGDDPRDCLDRARAVSEMIDASMPLAFDENLGYLTACPTNLGTGLRASALMHLPALTNTSAMQRILAQAGANGFTIRGLYGEGTQALWGYYQISNSQTLGRTENELVSVLEEAAKQLEEAEKGARSALAREKGLWLEDAVWRAYGLLTNARRLTTQEAMENLGILRLGACAGIINKTDIKTIDRLSVELWPGNLIEAKGMMDEEQRDKARADLIRAAME